MTPPSGSGASPCLSAFSISVPSTSGGTSAVEQLRPPLRIGKKKAAGASGPHAHLQDGEVRARKLEFAP